MNRFLLTALLLGSIFTLAKGQNHAYVDEQGIMRWGNSHQEVYGFGVNYTVPFAHAYRSAEKLNISPREAIDNDVYHFARLGFDAYRVHVWDTEISDTLGNLLENDHLELFDYMLWQMKSRGLKFLITPIAFWGNGWPEPDQETPGFSHRHGKDSSLTREAAIKAQENYLYQFLNHVNPYTNLAYKDDPAIVAFEISNEPHHRAEASAVTSYIQRLVNAMKKTGNKKPVFYNISHGIHLVDAYYEAGIQGGTFQWYPTGLGAGEELQGNFLPNVDAYTIPFADNPRFRKGAKVVYEFDAADVGRSYIYPAMARSFRTAGIQWATHFAYDPTYLAYANTEYNTHFMNLAYTPAKAISLKLASQVFHRIPLYADYGAYPANAQFENFRISYEEDLAELNTAEKFVYTNHTASKPKEPKKLREITGCGNSAVVSYAGTGAYFLDKIEKGVWRLEVMPDALQIANPFGRNSLKREVAVINWREWPMSVNLPDLGENFSLQPLNEGNEWHPEVNGTTFLIRPGTYFVIRKETKTQLSGMENWKNIRLNEFSAPESTLKTQHVLHKPLLEISPKKNYYIKATVISATNPESVEIVGFTGFRPKRYTMKNVTGYEYTTEIPSKDLKEGIFRYFIVVTNENGQTTYPCGTAGSPSDWDFQTREMYSVNVVDAESPLYLFNALTDSEKLRRKWLPGSFVVPFSEPGKGELRVKIEKLHEPDPENPDGPKINAYAMHYTFKEKLPGRTRALEQAKELVFRGRSLTGKKTTVEVALVSIHGKAFGQVIELYPEAAEYKIPFADLQEVKLATLPRPYPTFLPYYFEGGGNTPFEITDTESLQICIGPGLSTDELLEPQGIAIETIRIE